MIYFIQYKKCFFWGMTILWMALIFYFSGATADVSKKQDAKITRPFFDAAYPEGIKLEPNLPLEQHAQYGEIAHQVRKSAHVLLYTALGIWVGLSMLVIHRFRRREFIISLAICMMYALSDEIHQYFVPGRGMMIEDVVLDTLASFFGLMLLHGILLMKQKRDVGKA